MDMENKKRINRFEFNEILRNLVNISPKEREYLNNAFSQELLDGIDEWELKNKISKLYYNQEDGITPAELDQIKRKILEKFSK
jgi:hypothetical protein